MTVEATDGTLKDSANFYLNIIDVNMLPVFSQAIYPSTINEGYDLDTVFLTVVASEDTDVSSNAIITYSIVFPDGYVENELDCLTEMNVTNTTSSFESVTESGSGSGSGSGNSEVEVIKNITVVKTEMLENCAAFPFVINSENGKISLQSELDYEQNTTWTFSVVATDSAVVPQSATALVNITVTDDNDEEPYFTKNNYTITVQEDLAER